MVAAMSEALTEAMARLRADMDRWPVVMRKSGMESLHELQDRLDRMDPADRAAHAAAVWDRSSEHMRRQIAVLGNAEHPAHESLVAKMLASDVRATDFSVASIDYAAAAAMALPGRGVVE